MVELSINLPEDFLKEEERCGFLVSKKMKEIWAVELDLLSVFQKVADKHQIKYIASGGTMLGAARHKGFIPWDDDVDIMMLREDYNKLLSVAEEFEHPYFLQSNRNDKGFFRCFLRLRNSNTTGIQQNEFKCHFKYNQGIFIDIFPLDNVVEDMRLFVRQQFRAKLLLKKAMFYSSLQSRYYRDKNIIKRLQRNLLRSLVLHKDTDEHYLFEYEKEVQRYNDRKTERISLLSFQFGHRIHDIKLRDMYEVEEMDFEFLKVPVPKDYDNLLTWKYGDWKTPLQFPNYHGDVFFDVDKPYTSYI